THGQLARPALSPENCSDVTATLNVWPGRAPVNADHKSSSGKSLGRVVAISDKWSGKLPRYDVVGSRTGDIFSLCFNCRRYFHLLGSLSFMICPRVDNEYLGRGVLPEVKEEA